MDLSLLLPVISLIFTVVSKLLLLYSTIDKTSTLKMISFSTVRVTQRGSKKIWNASRICVSSLRRGHANLLCIVPIFVYVLPKRALPLLVCTSPREMLNLSQSLFDCLWLTLPVCFSSRRGNEKQWGGVASTCWKPMQGWEVKDRKQILDAAQFLT